MAEFRTRYAAKYAVPVVVEPVVRPSFIPMTTVIGGSSFPVVFQPGLGYGCYAAGNTWTPYDAVEEKASAAYDGLASQGDRPPVMAAERSGSGSVADANAPTSHRDLAFWIAIAAMLASAVAAVMLLLGGRRRPGV